jgi:hypothetical protein
VRHWYDERAKERMSQGGGDKKSGVENLPHPIENTSKARDAAGKAVGVSGKLVVMLSFLGIGWWWCRYRRCCGQYGELLGDGLLVGCQPGGEHPDTAVGVVCLGGGVREDG